MDNIIIIIINSIFPVAIAGFIAWIIYAVIPKPRRPRYSPGQDVLGQNYVDAAGKYVPCKITSSYTEWYQDGKFIHYYICAPEGKKGTLTLSEDRIKSVSK